MADCECLATCIFFNEQMANMPVTVELTKGRYCRGDNSRCARFMVFQALGLDRVPSDLFPNEVGLARKIIAQG
jgi:hypothetical protein